jgi:hypothetical protein
MMRLGYILVLYMKLSVLFSVARSIYLGDFIDRGLTHLKVIDIVRPMVEQGHALAVMGNHEYNAICFQTIDPMNPGCWLRPRTNKNILQHLEFLKPYAGKLDRLDGDIEWFKTLPLWLDLGELRIVHACWDDAIINEIKNSLSNDAILNEAFLINSANKQHWAFDAVETILKGREIPLPEGHSFNDKDGHARHHIRVRWWDKLATNYRDAFMGPKDVLSCIPDISIEGDFEFNYCPSNPPVFVGHYWMQGEPKVLAPNIACVDYSVANQHGQLVAYRWDGEVVLTNDKFVSVKRLV